MMPKKFKGENSKAAAARARKEALKQEAADQKQKEIDDAYWADDDKHVKQKQQRKEDRERKQREAAERKVELQKLYEQEMEASRPKAKATPPPKLTRVQIQASRKEIEEENAKAKEEVPVNEMPLEENVNRLMEEEDARNIEDAIAVLSTKEEAVDRHPEKRMKAAYKAYEEENLPRIKAENPNMRLSQLKQMLHKDWMKSPQNPLNQARGSS